MGGRGSVLAVTSQHAGDDGAYGTHDDLFTPINMEPSEISIDNAPGDDCDDPLDRVRGFYSRHRTGANFVFADGSTHYLLETIDRRLYQELSTYTGGKAAFVPR